MKEKELLEGFFKLSSKVAIYVPSTINVNQAFDSTQKVEETLRFMGSKFGGATSVKARGSWVNQFDSSLVIEDITICVSYTNQETLEESIEDLKKYCIEMKEQLQQQSIAIELKDSLYLI